MTLCADQCLLTEEQADLQCNTEGRTGRDNDRMNAVNKLFIIMRCLCLKLDGIRRREGR